MGVILRDQLPLIKPGMSLAFRDWPIEPIYLILSEPKKMDQWANNENILCIDVLDLKRNIKITLLMMIVKTVNQEFTQATAGETIYCVWNGDLEEENA